jgi:uncharacterized damage-inducible protein DinB
MAMSRKERIADDFKRIRDQLKESLEGLTQDEFTWKPRPDMKSVKEMLRECGEVEKLFVTFFRDGTMLEFGKAVQWSGEDVASTMADLEKIRQETIQALNQASEADLEKVLKAKSGREWVGEEIFRSSARHEYYHLGQVVYNRWLLGHNPYSKK